MKKVKEIAWEDFKGRIPVTDVDGIDLKPEYLAEAENVEFQNGYIVNSGSIIEQTLPTTVQTLISDNYNLVDNTFFEHSKVGFVDIYILWKTNNLRIVVNNQIMNLNPVGGGNTAITFLEAPKKVNYNLVNDQLKINLNCRARYTNIDPAKDVILNLTLIYFSEDRVYYETNVPVDSADVEFFEESDIVASPNPIFTKDMVGGQFVIGGDAEYQFIVIEYIDEYTIRVNELFAQNAADITDFNVTIQQVLKYSAGWYCFPRWLGWSYDPLQPYIYNQYFAGEIIEDFTDSFYIPNLTIPTAGSSPWIVNHSLGYVEKTGYGRTSPMRITKLRNIGKIKVELESSSLGVFHNATIEAELSFKVFKGNKLIASKSLDTTMLNTAVLLKEFEVELNAFDIEGDLELRIEALANKTGEGTWTFSLKIYALTLIPSKVIILGFYEGGQRALLQNDVGVGVYGDDSLQLKLYVREVAIDFRIISYEVYKEENNVFYLLGRAKVEAGWISAFTEIYKTIEKVAVDEPIQTLNFNYGLGEVRVDNQKEIYSEVEYRRRVYFVKNDFRIYQSHIAGNGLVQSDSFPFNEDNGYGFIETGRNSINTALAITPTNDLLIYHKEGFYIYRIQGIGVSLNRELRLLNNTAGIQTPYSLNKTIDGSPSFAGLFWINKEGVWYYAGGVSQPPVNLITQTHRNFWLKFTPIDYESPITFFVPSRNEYWIKINAANVFLVYEASYNQFRTYKLNTYVEKFIGIKNGKILFKSINKIYEFRYEVSNTSLPGMVTTHWRDEGVKYRFNKIMQEVFVEFTKESSASREVAVYVYADKYLVGSYVIKSNELIARRLLPLFIRFQKVKIILWLPSLEVRVSRFGVTYTEDGEGNLGFNSDKELSPFDAGGYGTNYGGSYGSGGW